MSSVDFYDAVVLESRPAAEGLVHIKVEGGNLLEHYLVPGQYVQVRMWISISSSS